jgi:hypothetical protein
MFQEKPSLDRAQPFGKLMKALLRRHLVVLECVVVNDSLVGMATKPLFEKDLATTSRNGNKVIL